MYPINNATPERIAVGQVILIADGTIQTSGVVITTRGQGGAETTGDNAAVYGADGTVYYTPSQAETNFTSFIVIASKASCLSASQTVITSASGTAGHGGVDWANVANPTTAVDLSGTDIQLVDTATTVTGGATSAAQTTAQNDLDIITGADGAALASTQQSITFQPIVITAGNGIANITLAGSGSADGLEFTRSGSGDPLDANFIAQLDAMVDTAITNGDIATETKQDIIDSNVDLTLADTNELQTDWANAGRLDAILDSRMAEASISTTAGAVDNVTLTATTTAVTNEVTADVTKISGSATAANNLEESTLGIQPGACEGTPSVTVIQTNLAETADDHFIGRIVVFTSGVAAQQASDITDYTGSTGTITVTALTTAPAASDTFVIV